MATALGGDELFPEVHELDGDGKFMGAHGGDNGLQFIANIAVHTPICF